MGGVRPCAPPGPGTTSGRGGGLATVSIEEFVARSHPHLWDISRDTGMPMALGWGENPSAGGPAQQIGAGVFVRLCSLEDAFPWKIKVCGHGSAEFLFH